MIELDATREVAAIFAVGTLLSMTMGFGCERSGPSGEEGERPERGTAGGGEATAESTGETGSPSAESAQRDGGPTAIPGGTEPRTFEFRYEATLEPGEGSDVDVFLPLATDSPHQEILERTIEAPVDGEIRSEEVYGNQFWHGRLERLPEKPQSFRVVYEVRRQVFRREELDERAGGAYADSVPDEHELFLQANERVPLEGELIDEVIADSGVEDVETPLAKARTIYRFVIDKMEYKKVGEGWGNGDTYWACSKEYGNCTDYHALYTSMARNQGIPARFEIGFPVPTDRPSGTIGGYHCWLQFYLPKVGWTPIDVSEADKHPEYKEMYFGTHPANRIRFTVGRDLELGEGHDTGPLNYFVYPHVEVGDERYDGVKTEFSYRDIEG